MVYSLDLTITAIKDAVTVHHKYNLWGGCMDVGLVTHPYTQLNGVSGDDMLIAGLIPRHLRKAERGSGHR